MNPEEVDAFDEAMSRSGEWMSSGSPAHRYEPGRGGWCAACGCGRPGQQHADAMEDKNTTKV